MNGYLNLRWYFDLMYSWLDTIQTAILIIGFTGVSLPVTAQIKSQQSCETDTPVFTDIPNQTLCEKFMEFSCDTEIGAGTDYPMSSLIGSSLSGNVCIKGTFVVDKDFIFDAATVKINPGVTIIINSNILLSIDNSKLFACDDLWKGITLNQLSSIATSNSEIEDAITAISATGLCGLSIENTIFNRDRVGLELTNFSQGSLDWTFTGNTFTCDAPLNGTQNEITYAGVKLTDSYFQTRAKNSFSFIQYGILAEGNTSYIVAQNLEFQDIFRDGINMSKGYINLRQSKFTNCYENGIHITTAHNVSIWGNCNFLWNDNLPLLTPDVLNVYSGIKIKNFAIASKINISSNTFSADLTSKFIRIFGVSYEASYVGGGTAILMTENTIHFYGGPAVGINLQGDFPSQSQIDIYNNDFDLQNTLGAADPTCIYSFGNRYDFDIIANRFNNKFPKVGWPMGMVLVGSEGNNNQVSDNSFEGGLYLNSYLAGVQTINFKNTKFCANRFVNTRGAFSFNGQNNGTDFTGNIAYGPQLLSIGDQSFIEDQDQKGNQWTSEYQGTIFPFIATPQAECKSPSFANFSEFFVHTPQSTYHSGFGFNPFHPRDLSPDNDIEWWFQAPGTPASVCVDERPGSGDTQLKRAVTEGSFAERFDDPSMNWQAQRAVYFALKQTPALVGLYPAYSTFISENEGDNIGKLYQVTVALNNARNGKEVLRNNAAINRTLIDDMLSQIDAADYTWQNAVTLAEKEIATSAKQQKIGELMLLVHNATTLQEGVA